MAEDITLVAYNKLMMRSLSPFCTIAVNSHSLVVDEYDVHSTISIHRATHAPTYRIRIPAKNQSTQGAEPFMITEVPEIVT